MVVATAAVVVLLVLLVVVMSSGVVAILHGNTPAELSMSASGEEPANAADWRFDRDRSIEWGPGGNECGPKVGTILEYEGNELERNTYGGIHATWSEPVLERNGRAGVRSSRSPSHVGHQPRKHGETIVADTRHWEYSRGRYDHHHHHQQQRLSPPTRSSSAGRLRALERHHHHRRRRRRNAETTAFTETRSQNGWGGQQSCRAWSDEEEGLSGWRSAPEGGSNGYGYGGVRNKQRFGGATVGESIGVGVDMGWRSRGALGRRPASREAARQLRVSERLHQLGQAMAKKKERIRRRRDDLQQAKVSVTCQPLGQQGHRSVECSC